MDMHEEIDIEQMEENNSDVHVEVIRDGPNIIDDELSSDNDSRDDSKDEELSTQTDMLCENEAEHEDHSLLKKIPYTMN